MYGRYAHSEQPAHELCLTMRILLSHKNVTVVEHREFVYGYRVPPFYRLPIAVAIL